MTNERKALNLLNEEVNKLDMYLHKNSDMINELKNNNLKRVEATKKENEIIERINKIRLEIIELLGGDEETGTINSENKVFNQTLNRLSLRVMKAFEK